MKNRLKAELDRELECVRVSDDLRARILLKAETPVRKRRLAVPILAAACIAAILLCMGAFAVHRVARSPQDTTLSDGGESWAWISQEDDLYHARRNCGGLTDAERVLLTAAKADGRTACPNCIAQDGLGGADDADAAQDSQDTTFDESFSDASVSFEFNINTESEGVNSDPGEESADETEYDGAVYTASGESYYHLYHACGGRTFNLSVDEAVAAGLGKAACPICFPDTEVWMTGGGTYFHTAQNCSGMINAFLTAREIAAADGKIECPICSGSENVFTSWGAAVYHSDSQCGGVTYSRQISLAEALSEGMSACPDCCE